MTTDAPTLAQFLLARVAEDEAVASAAAEYGATWTQIDPVRAPGQIESSSGIITYDEGSPNESEGAHIARHDPARVLAQCAAIRAVVTSRHVECSGHPGPYKPHADYGPGYCWREDEGDDLLLALAAMYADHPDFQDDWKP